MAQRRMFSMKIIDTDIFLDMPISSQLLYFHLSMRADDDGFVSSPKKIIKMVNCSDDDFKILIMKKFILPFESGICVILQWRIHNYIQNDRYNKTLYQSEINMLVDNEGTYEVTGFEGIDTKCIHDVHKTDTQVRLGKVSKGKVRLDNIVDIPYKEIVDYLNLKATTKYKSSGVKTRDLIKARWNEEFNLDDFKTVIDKKVNEWNHEPIPDKEDMRMYLRPSTLFGPKFEGYLNQKGGVKSGTDSWGYKPTNKVLTAAEIAKLKDDESKLI